MTKTIDESQSSAGTPIRFDPFAVSNDTVRIDSFADDAAEEAVAQRLLASQRRRGLHFDAALFRDPAWDIMLVLFIAQCRGIHSSMDHACDMPGVPHATAIRIVQYLAKIGLVECHPNPADPDRTHLALSAEGNRGMRSFLADEATA